MEENIKINENYWTKLDEKAESLLLHKEYDAFTDYCAPHLNIWLDQDIENLIYDGEGKKAYELLCSKFPEIVVKRVEQGRQNPYDELYFNNIEFHCIRTKGACLYTEEEDIAEYFLLKGDFLMSEDKLRKLQFEEAMRLHCITHKEEIAEYIMSHNITI